MNMNDFDISDLNDGQKQAFHMMVEFLSDKSEDMFILKGYAGTGKTYLVKKLIKYYLEKHSFNMIAITAPTNKAVKVVKRSSGISDRRVEFMTIHRLLGLKEKILPTGKITFVENNDPNRGNSIDEFSVLVLDEVSMLDDFLFKKLEPLKHKLKIIFMGDPAQIPPVNQPDCIPFRCDELFVSYQFREFQLMEIMRQAMDNPIVEYAYGIRTNLSKNTPIENLVTKINESGKGVERVDRKDMRPLLSMYFNCPDFLSYPDHAKVIAWRNTTLNHSNDIIRKLIFGSDQLPRIVMGDKLVANSPILSPDRIILFYTSDEFEVVGFKIDHDSYRVNKKSQVTIQFYLVDAQYVDIDGEVRTKQIKVLHEGSAKNHELVADQLKSEAIRVNGDFNTWSLYYAFIREFADVKYNYATSAHKSQGSTYKNVFILEDDIDQNPRIFERNRIKYTAYSRPTDKLFILKS